MSRSYHTIKVNILTVGTRTVQCGAQIHSLSTYLRFYECLVTKESLGRRTRPRLFILFLEFTEKELFMSFTDDFLNSPARWPHPQHLSLDLHLITNVHLHQPSQSLRSYFVSSPSYQNCPSNILVRNPDYPCQS